MPRSHRIRTSSLALAVVLCATLLALVAQAPAQAAFANFVTRTGGVLKDGTADYRFAGANIQELGWMSFPQALVDDGLATAKEMGATVVRGFGAVSAGCKNGWVCIEPSLNTFDDTKFANMDYALKKAEDLGIRLILPLTSNWNSDYGDWRAFTTWRGLPESEFWNTSSVVFTDFKAYIEHFLNHANPLKGGLQYKDDKTILAWETGNEIPSTATWTQAIANYIKDAAPAGLAAGQLVADGDYDVITTAALSLNANVSMYSNHYYPPDNARLVSDANLVNSYNKVFFVGEWPHTMTNHTTCAAGPTTRATWLATIENSATYGIDGDLHWALSAHGDDYGVGTPGPCRIHIQYPGASYGMRQAATDIRTHGYTMRFPPATPPADAVPTAPVITLVERRGAYNVIEWRGAVGGDRYTVDRSPDGVGSWTTVCNLCATDFEAPWWDRTTPAGTWWYRVAAQNKAGVMGPYSATWKAQLTVDPMSSWQPNVTHSAGLGFVSTNASKYETTVLVDEMVDFTKTFAKSANLGIDTTFPEVVGNDHYRAYRTVTGAEWITWYQPGATAAEATAYFWSGEPVTHMTFQQSTNNTSWTTVTPTITQVANWDPNDFIKVTYRLSGLTKPYVRAKWPSSLTHWNPQLSRMRLFTGDTARVARTGGTPTAEWVTWNTPNIKNFEMTAYFSTANGGAENTPYDLKVYTSPDNSVWTEVPNALSFYPWGSGDWTKWVYKLRNLSGINYVRINWFNTAPGRQVDSPQIATVTIGT